jgi:hypothetical protein
MAYLDKSIAYQVKACYSRDILEHLRANPTYYNNLEIRTSGFHIQIRFIGSTEPFILILRDSLMVWRRMIEYVEDVIKSINRANTITYILASLEETQPSTNNHSLKY